MSSFFTKNPTITQFKIDATLTTYSNTSGISTGKASLIFKINQTPKGGICNVTPLKGITADTLFTINCLNWVDLDGQIVKYSYYGKKRPNKLKKICLNKIF